MIRRRLSSAGQAVVALLVVALLTVSLAAMGAAAPQDRPPVSVPVLPPISTVAIDPTLPNMSTLSPPTAAPAVMVSPATNGTVQVTPARRPVVAPPSWARCPQWWRTAQRVGWPVGLLPTLDYVMHRESRCIPTAANDFGYTGLIQIGRAHLSAPGYTGLCARTKGRICTADDLKKPRKNLRAGWLMYQDAQRIWGCGWHHWYLGSWRPC